jgi:hypothetical protein
VHAPGAHVSSDSGSVASQGAFHICATIIVSWKPHASHSVAADFPSAFTAIGAVAHSSGLRVYKSHVFPNASLNIIIFNLEISI